MGKPSRTRDLMGAVLLVLVGLLYMSGVSDRPMEQGADRVHRMEIVDVSGPAPVEAGPEHRT